MVLSRVFDDRRLLVMNANSGRKLTKRLEHLQELFVCNSVGVFVRPWLAGEQSRELFIEVDEVLRVLPTLCLVLRGTLTDGSSTDEVNLLSREGMAVPTLEARAPVSKLGCGCRSYLRSCLAQPWGNGYGLGSTATRRQTSRLDANDSILTCISRYEHSLPRRELGGNSLADYQNLSGASN